MTLNMGGPILGPKGTAVARLTGLEPATPGVTGRYSNHLSYNRPLSADLHQRGVLLGTQRFPVKP